MTLFQANTGEGDGNSGLTRLDNRHAKIPFQRLPEPGHPCAPHDQYVRPVLVNERFPDLHHPAQGLVGVRQISDAEVQRAVPGKTALQSHRAYAAQVAWDRVW